MSEHHWYSRLNWRELCYPNVTLEDIQQLVQLFGNDILYEVDQYGYFPLHWAVIADRCNVAEYMMGCGVPVGLRVKNRSEPESIHLAAVEGNIEMIDTLIRNEANVNAVDNIGSTPLMRAAMFGYNNCTKGAETVLHLLSRGARIDDKDDNGMNALHYATIKNSDETVHLLLTVGINANEASDEDIKPIDIAAENGNVDLIKLLDPLTSDRNFDTYLKNWFLYKPRTFRQTMEAVFILLSKLFILTCFLATIFWIYPQYFFHYLPLTKNHYFIHCILIPASTCVWYFWYRTVRRDPGFIETNTEEYYEILRTKLSLANRMKTTKWLPTDPNSGIKLCHTCKTIQPNRSKHCRFCNRCTARFDHHCIYLSTCIGESNRLSFFGFIAALFTSGVLLATIILITVKHENWVFSSYHVSNLSYCLKIVVVGGVMTVSTIRRAAINLTQNEEIRSLRYKYLRTKSGNFRNPFDKGVLVNLLEHFNLNDAFRDRFRI